MIISHILGVEAMVKEILRKLATDVKDKASADQLVDFIYDSGGFKLQNTDWTDNFADKETRLILFSGCSVSGGTVKLSPKASLLKLALQTRHAQSLQADPAFQPIDLYHITSSRTIAYFIISGGFNVHSGTMCGYGTYFFTSEQRAKDYRGPVIVKNGVEETQFVIKVQAFTNIYAASQAGDSFGKGTWALQRKDMVCVKNPLLVFPVSFEAN